MLNVEIFAIVGNTLSSPCLRELFAETMPKHLLEIVGQQFCVMGIRVSLSID